MDIDKIPTQTQPVRGIDPSTPVQPASEKEQFIRQSAFDGETFDVKDKHSTNDERVKVESIGFARLEQDKIKFQELAQSIRHSDQVLSTLDKHLEKMESLVETLVKQYPPFPPDSRQKINLIKQFNALWHLIKKLEMPPETDSATQDREFKENVPGNRVDDASKIGTLWTGINKLAFLEPKDRLNNTLQSVRKARSMVTEKRNRLTQKAVKIAAGI